MILTTRDEFKKYTFANPNKKTYLVEIKPKAQTMKPQGSRQTAKFLKEATTYLVNQAKWEYARRYSKDRNWEFIILTEDELGL